jgi:hypothetical protein
VTCPALTEIISDSVLPLREVAEDQIDISHEQSESTLRPIVVAVLTSEPGLLALQNIGNGPALNVKVHPVVTGKDGDLDVRLKFHASIVAMQRDEIGMLGPNIYVGD